MISRTGPAGARARLNWKMISAAIVISGVALFAVANAHLVYVAVASQPDCVPHAKEMGEAGTYKAARSAC